VALGDRVRRKRKAGGPFPRRGQLAPSLLNAFFSRTRTKKKKKKEVRKGELPFPFSAFETKEGKEGKRRDSISRL